MGTHWKAPQSPYRVPFDGSFRIKDVPTGPESKPDRSSLEEDLRKRVRRISKLQKKLNADDRYSVLFVFQAMDAAGKDGTIRAVFTGVNPAGFQVFNFKEPTHQDLDHDFLWRVARRLPERGRIGVFNRSHYEEVLVVRVHPEYLDAQRLPEIDMGRIWEQRFDSIRGFEEHLNRNGTIVVKFFLNVSKEQQKKRLLDRIEEPDSNWKFSSSDVKERALWKDYMNAFEGALNATSRPHAPWYAVPADNKPYMRVLVAEIVEQTLKKLDVDYPEMDDDKRDVLERARHTLEQE